MPSPIAIRSFYSFAPITQPEQYKAPLLERMRALGVRGTITLATEGVNATISGAASAIEHLMGFLQSTIPFCAPAIHEHTFAEQPFRRSKVKVKRELISLGVPVQPSVCVGEYVRPQEWNALMTASDVVVIDTRNDYEFALGHFRGAVNPATRNFKQMVAWTKANLNPQNNTRIAMYCTGGIRCEKYSSYLVAQGFRHVYHLHGGILAYLEQIPPSQSLWEGECFVFDERVSVAHGYRRPSNPILDSGRLSSSFLSGGKSS